MRKVLKGDSINGECNNGKIISISENLQLGF